MTLQETLIIYNCDYKNLVSQKGDVILQNKDYKKIVDNIKNIIESKGLKQGSVAKKAGFTDQQFSNILCYRKLLRAEYIPSIAHGLGVDVNELFM